MPTWVTWQHGGLVLAIIGSICLAYSLKVTRQYSGEMADVADRLKGSDLIEPTESHVSPTLFRLGLAFIILGTALQW